MKETVMEKACVIFLVVSAFMCCQNKQKNDFLTGKIHVNVASS